MKPFTFQTTPNVLFESGASKKVADLAAEFGAQRILLVTDRGVRDAGLTKAAEEALKAAGRDLVRVRGCGRRPAVRGHRAGRVPVP